jgi:lipopolysaccharide/colanic/teichoic acid biosynthesis glycosyltransferase
MHGRMADWGRSMLKRTIDLAASGAGLILLGPLFLVIAIAVKSTSRGPVFFRQERLGRGGVPFRIFKFRTMVSGAERQGARVTGAGDSRITPVGAFLRRHKLDELPQLINVLRGEMSLVGPRPEVPEFAAVYPEEFARLLTVKPGITHRATQLFRNEEQILAAAADPRTFYVERILPRKLSLYLQDLGGSVRDDLGVIVDTVLNRSTAIELAFVASPEAPEPHQAPAAAAAPIRVLAPARTPVAQQEVSEAASAR